jgi:beta-galactosidase
LARSLSAFVLLAACGGSGSSPGNGGTLGMAGSSSGESGSSNNGNGGSFYGAGTANGTSGAGGSAAAAAGGVSGTAAGGALGGNAGALGDSGGLREPGGAAGAGGVANVSGAAGNGSSAGGTGPGQPEANRVRTLIPFDAGWLFNKGDAAGADQANFADSAWRALNVPHDWSIEGPFDQNAPTTGRGGYLPAGIGWYRKHFTLPQSLAGRRVFIEFDGVMANSDVYFNSVHLGNRPYGYVGFRYELTAGAVFGGADNVISVKCDNSAQPASRYYAGAGIYRHVRLIVSDPVHVDQWATYVATPTISSASATVHVTTVVVNQGTAAQNVTVQGVVSDPGGVALAPVAAPMQSVAAGKSASFTFDVTVANPKLWDLANPNLYSLTTNVQINDATVDDDVTPFGIRSLVFNATTGMTLNGKSLKFKGVAIHQEVSGLGVAVPERAWQRRLAQFKALGVNAVRTSHNPFAPEFLDLADRMGLLVMDEFFDVWAHPKYTDVGDYSAYFAKTAASPTGSPAVPAAIAGAGATWWQTDITDIVMHDRNHPSVVMYSTGNEIRDSLASRTPILTQMVALCHTLDPARPVTQALFQPDTAGDTTGATRTILDVWGNNYRVDSCLAAMSASPPRAGVLTEMGHETTTWTTVTSTPALTGEFLWAGADYLGEAPLGWPTVGASLGIMDRLGTPNADGYTWQKLWGAAVTAAPETGTTASKVVLSADHGALLTDLNDVSYVKASIADATGKLIATSAAPVTFTVSGPGVLIAVDSGSPIQESFRGTVRKAYNGVCFAIVQATGTGTITVTATADGLATGTTTVQASAGTFTPCSGTCD